MQKKHISENNFEYKNYSPLYCTKACKVVCLICFIALPFLGEQKLVCYFNLEMHQIVFGDCVDPAARVPIARSPKAPVAGLSGETKSSSISSVVLFVVAWNLRR